MRETAHAQPYTRAGFLCVCVYTTVGLVNEGHMISSVKSVFSDEGQTQGQRKAKQVPAVTRCAASDPTPSLPHVWPWAVTAMGEALTVTQAQAGGGPEGAAVPRQADSRAAGEGGRGWH